MINNHSIILVLLIVVASYQSSNIGFTKLLCTTCPNILSQRMRHNTLTILILCLEIIKSPLICQKTSRLLLNLKDLPSSTPHPKSSYFWPHFQTKMYLLYYQANHPRQIIEPSGKRAQTIHPKA